MVKWIWAAVLLLAVSSAVDAAEKWYKGNTHTHTFWSDGNDFPERIVKWYTENDYDFLVLSDHNILSRGEKWMSVEKLKERGGNDILEKYAASFGKKWVESRGTPGEKSHEIRLKRLGEFRDMFEVPAKFCMSTHTHAPSGRCNGPRTRAILALSAWSLAGSGLRLKSTSAQRMRSLPTVRIFPSGSS